MSKINANDLDACMKRINNRLFIEMRVADKAHADEIIAEYCRIIRHEIARMFRQGDTVEPIMAESDTQAPSPLVIGEVVWWRDGGLIFSGILVSFGKERAWISCQCNNGDSNLNLVAVENLFTSFEDAEDARKDQSNGGQCLHVDLTDCGLMTGYECAKRGKYFQTKPDAVEVNDVL